MCNVKLLDVQGLDCGVYEVADNGGGRVLDRVLCCLDLLVDFVHGIPGSILGALRSTLSRVLGVFCGVGSFVLSIIKDTPSENLVQVERRVGSGKVQIFEQSWASHGSIKSVKLHALEGVWVRAGNQAAYRYNEGHRRTEKGNARDGGVGGTHGGRLLKKIGMRRAREIIEEDGVLERMKDCRGYQSLWLSSTVVKYRTIC